MRLAQDRSTGRVGTMDLKRRLRQIRLDCRSLRHGRRRSRVALTLCGLPRFEAGGDVHPISPIGRCLCRATAQTVYVMIEPARRWQDGGSTPKPPSRPARDTCRFSTRRTVASSLKSEQKCITEPSANSGHRTSNTPISLRFRRSWPCRSQQEPGCAVRNRPRSR